MKSYILLIAILLTIVSCSKSIDLDPTHSVNGDDFFKTVDEYEQALTGTYQRLKQNSLYGGVNGGSVFLSSVDIAADNFYSGPNNLGNLNNMFRWNYTADDPVVQGAWDAAYLVIQQANISMRGIERFRNDEPLKVNRIEGQARAIRAFMHFELLRWWANDFDRNATTLGIAYSDTFDIERKPARLTVKQSYDKIEADLKTAKSMMSNMDKAIQSPSSTAATARAYVDTLVVNAMLARMYLYANEWDSAIKYSSYVIDARPLASPDEFPMIWQDATTTEVIWSVNYQAGNQALAREIYQPSGDQLQWRPVTALLDLYETNDIRDAAYWRTRNGRIVLNKYFAKSTSSGNPDGVVNFKVFRTAEMYLIRAEAYAMNGDDVMALSDLNDLRAARNASVGAETGADLLDAIQVERRKELVVEGHRFFDLKRTTRTVNRTQSCSNYCTLASNSRAWALPVPQTERLANNNMQQNPGY